MTVNRRNRTRAVIGTGLFLILGSRLEPGDRMATFDELGQRQARLALQNAKLFCLDHPLQRAFVRDLRVESLRSECGVCRDNGADGPNFTATVVAYGVFRIPLARMSIGCDAGTCGRSASPPNYRSRPFFLEKGGKAERLGDWLIGLTALPASYL